MVDGKTTKRQAHGRPVPLQFRRSAARYFHTCAAGESQCQSASKTKLGQYGEEVVQETIRGIYQG